MKKIFIISSFIMLLASLASRAESISVDSAATIANKFLAANAASWQVDIKKSPGQLHAPSKSGSKAAYYLFKGNDHRGFVIVSADDAARPILGYSFDAAVSETDALPTGMQDWLNDIERQIRMARENGMEQVTSQPQDATSLDVGNTKVKLTTAEWGQGFPFNYECPSFDGKRCFTGCVPTAYAILMKYYQYPSAGTGTTTSFTTATNKIYVGPRSLNHSYNWSSMPLKYESDQYSNEARNQVATLMADIGASMQADYGTNSTSTNYDRGDGAMYKYFNYYPGQKEFMSTYSVSSWYSKLRNELDQKRPIIYCGEDECDNNEGHLFMLDGYTDKNYFSVNWGWSGSYNGFFALDAFQPGEPGKHNYTNQSANFGCMPMPQSNASDVVEMNGTMYPSFIAALSMAPTNGEHATIKLLTDILTNGFNVDSNKNITINLNGKRLHQFYFINNYGVLSITDNTSNKDGKITRSGGSNAQISNYNTLQISSGTLQYTGNNAVISNLSKSGKLTITGGTLTNAASSFKDKDYRRAIWTDEGTNTVIEGGTFSSPNQTLCLNGNGVIRNGTFTTTGNVSVVSNYNKSGTLTISGGSFINKGSATGAETDYRRSVWTAAGTNTVIEDGTFSSPYQVLCFNGNVTIRNGSFTTTGNNDVVSNYNKNGSLTINGGSFVNNASSYTGTDYRRAVWCAEGTSTIINNGTFSSSYQTMCFNGNATISNATITNPGTGYGVLAFSNSLVSIVSCKLKANNLFYTSEGSTIACEGGLFSKAVDSQYLKNGAVCTNNNDNNTRSEYPYAVVSTNPSYRLGDVNRDGMVDVRDMAVILRAILDGTTTLLPNSADINDDGVIDVRDMAKLLNMILGK